VVLSDSVRRRIVAAATSPFGHAPYPLARSLRYRGDPGLIGPGSVSWQVIGDVSAFVGGIRALLIQAAHPEVVAGVADHSRYREDPLGRLSRTSAYVTATTFGAVPEVERAVELVRRAHRPVRGRSHRGDRYAADAPELAAWVHNALTDSFLAAYQHFGPTRLDRAEADRFVAEQARIGRMLDADPLPPTAGELREWITWHPALAPSPGMEEAVAFLTDPPLAGPGLRTGYRLMQAAAVGTVPVRLRTVLGLRARSGAAAVGRGLIDSLRWALGASPSWQLALVRSGAEVPRGLFRQPLPPLALEAVDRPA
jgi:uncharacterized protein (DUF2236 family)